jgi:hypothetical protein
MFDTKFGLRVPGLEFGTQHEGTNAADADIDVGPHRNLCLLVLDLPIHQDLAADGLVRTEDRGPWFQTKIQG